MVMNHAESLEGSDRDRDRRATRACGLLLIRCACCAATALPPSKIKTTSWLREFAGFVTRRTGRRPHTGHHVREPLDGGRDCPQKWWKLRLTRPSSLLV